SGHDRGEQVTLATGPVTFGSAPSCDLVLSDKTVSRKHAEAYLDGNQTILRDLGSTNGSFIQGARFKEVALGYGAEVKLGKTLLKFLPEEEAVLPVEAESADYGQLRGSDPKMRRLFSLLEDIA